MKENFICPNCGNSDPKYLGNKNGKVYCRLCVTQIAKEKIIKEDVKSSKLVLHYGLTDKQKEVSNQLISNYKNRINTLVYAVTGAGKSEIVYHLIEYCLRQNLSVGFAIPRRQVVIELKERIQKAFPYSKVIAVYGGQTDQLVADIIVLTTHQLYRYQGYFDLLILDEIDAFPFQDNKLLNSMFFKAVKGNYVLMSATPSKETLHYFSSEGKDVIFLNERYHKKPIPVPTLVVTSGYSKYLYLIRTARKLIENGSRLFIFSPTIEKCETLFKIMNKFIKKGNYVHSKRENKEEIIKDFQFKKYNYLVTTAVLERGVTVKGLDVIVVESQH